MTETSCSTRRRDPTPEEIESECLLIRSGWSDEERLKRLRVDLRPYFRRADGQRETIDAAAYEIHHSTREVHIVT
jgi:hypothetical protein